jgi:DNA-binding response OmpR family regulator
MQDNETTHGATTLSKAPNHHKILVAEDNPVVRKGLNNFLVKWGYEPIEADNGDTAWNTLKNDPAITLAILDWNIPGLSGMQVCQRIRGRTEGPYVYTVIFSARSSIEEQVLALEGGADDYLVKPAKPSLLRARLGVGLRLLTLLADPRTDSAKERKPNP